MKYYSITNIISKKVLNENTGQLEEKEFIEKKYRKSIKGGHNIMYHIDYHYILKNAIKSSKDMQLFIWITEQFTYKKVEVSLSFSRCKVNISQPHFSKMIKKLVELDYLMRVARGVYRLNPLIYVPYKANTEELQDEWLQLKREQAELEKLEEANDLQKSIKELQKIMDNTPSGSE